MKSERNRLDSFRTPHFDIYCPVVPEKLAEAGFCNVSTAEEAGKLDIVCAFCQKMVRDWKPGDDPARKHYRESPKCPFVMGHRDEENVPLDDTQDKSLFGFLKPRRPFMAELDDRLSTFTEWPMGQPSSHALATAGLYYLGKGDAVRCYWCAGSLENWKVGDDPLTEHRRKYPDCVFLEKYKTPMKRKMKKLEMCDSSNEEICDSSNEEICNSSNEEKCKSLTCVVCLNERREILFLKCHHIVSCRDCSARLIFCPICRNHILKKVVIYLS